MSNSGKADKVFMIDGVLVKDFEQVFRYFYPPLYRYAYSFVMDEMEAEDIVQETFSLIWERQEKLPEQLDIRSYLYTSVKNACLKYFRRLKLTDEYRKKQTEALCLSFTGAADDEEEVTFAVNGALNKLTEQQARIVKMHIAEGLTYQEIASQLNLSDNTVKTHLKRAYKFLREQLTSCGMGMVILCAMVKTFLKFCRFPQNLRNVSNDERVTMNEQCEPEKVER